MPDSRAIDEVPAARRSRLPLLIALLTGLAMSLALLGAAHSAPSLGAETGAPAPEEDEWWAEEECEEAECEAEAEEEAETFDQARCAVVSLHARVFAPARGTRLRAKVRYRTVEPVTTYVDLRPRGPRGSLDLGLEKRRLGLRGSFELRRRLLPTQMAIAREARYFQLTVEVPGAPPACRPHLVKRLGAKARGPGRRVWAG